MNPVGKVESVRTLPSILTKRLLRIARTSRPVSAYLPPQRPLDLPRSQRGGPPLETVAQEDDQREAVALWVRSARRLRRLNAQTAMRRRTREGETDKDPAELVEHPVARRVEALQVLLRSARHDVAFMNAASERNAFSSLV